MAVEGKYDGHVASFGKRYFLHGPVSVFRHPGHHVALASRQRGASHCIGLLLAYGIELSIVVDLKLHGGIRHESSLRIHDGDGQLLRRRIVVDDVNLRVAVGLAHHFLRAVVVSKGFGVHQHAA